MQNQQTQCSPIDNNNSIQNTSVNDKGSKDNLIVYKIILGVIGLAIIILGIFDLIIFLTPKQNNTPDKENESSGRDDEENDTPVKNNDTVSVGNLFNIDFNELTKEQTFDAFIAMQQPGYMPNNYTSPALALKEDETSIVLDYSYSSVEEINTIDYSVSNFGNNEITITPVDDYYVVVSTDDYKEKYSPAYWPKAISFNKKYVDYYEERTDKGVNDRIIFKDTSLPAVRMTLPAFASTYGVAQPNYVFSYDFTENDNNYVLTLNCIGISLDPGAYMDVLQTDNQPTSVTDMPYVVTHYTATLILDKETGLPRWDKQNSEGITNFIKSFPLNEQDKNRLSKYIR